MTWPIRIQRRRVAGWRVPPCTIGVSRPSRFGNPYYVERCGRRRWRVWSRTGLAVVGTFEDRGDAHKTAVEQFYYNLPAAELAAACEILAGHNLMCWCPPPPPGIADRDWCHAGWLLEQIPRMPLRCEAT